MRHYPIYLMDSISNRILEKTERFSGNETTLAARLKQLQSGYCEDERPRIQRVVATTAQGNSFECLIAVSDADYYYCSPLKPIKIRS